MSESVYPDWPCSSDDLVPLPNCPGPKLEPFDFHGPQEIEFLEYIGEGLHSHVIKIRIHGIIYALKLFRFCLDEDWTSPNFIVRRKDAETMRAFYEYGEPFNCECRAFARLKEAGHEDLAVGCFGYVLLDEEHERKMQTQLNTEIPLNGSCECPYASCEEGWLRERFLGRDGRPPPIRCIVKEYAPPREEHEFRQADAEKALADVKKLQQLGIIRIDVGIRQIIGGRIADFSTAITTPHFSTSPELNPHLTDDMCKVIELETLFNTKNDYLQFDEMVEDFNLNYAQEHGAITTVAYPGGRGAPGLSRYDLRDLESQNRIYTYVDPRRYNWKWKLPQKKGVKKQRRRLRAKPLNWIFRCGGNKALYKRLMTCSCNLPFVKWEYRDGHVFPEVTERTTRILLGKNDFD